MAKKDKCGWEPLDVRVCKLKPEYEACPRCGGALVEAPSLGSNTIKRFCPPCDRPTTPLDAQVLCELKAIRALLERQTAVIAWHSGLQRSPFSPSPVDPEQAAEEARSAALARQSADPGVSLTRIDSL